MNSSTRLAGVPAFASCGVRIDALAIETAVTRVLDADAGAVHLCNAYTLSLASRDQSLAKLLNEGALNLADGQSVVWIARLVGLRHMTRRVYGPELMEKSIEEGHEHEGAPLPLWQLS